MYLLNELNFLSLFILLVLWWLSGELILQKFFSTNSSERAVLAIGFGLVLNIFSANLLGRFISTDVLFWGIALGWVIIAFLFHRKNFKNLKYPDRSSVVAIILFGILAILFTLIGRGFGFFDDHQNLPPLSVMAAGDIPPHFAFDPTLMFGYHYFLLLFGAAITKTAGATPWTALDLARGITLSLTLIYGGILAYRLTHSRIAQFFSTLVIAFAGGARWILLFLPASWLNHISSSVILIGSGADSGPNLKTALFKAWKIEGTGEIDLPFVYGSGLDPSFSMFHNGWGTSAILLVLLLLLLTGNKKPTWRAMPFLAIPLASLALANEVTYVFLYLGFIGALLLKMIRAKSIRKTLLDQETMVYFTAFFIAGLFALFQGGMLTEIFLGLFTPPDPANKETYFRVGFSLVPPAFLSAHLGSLSLLNPKHWFPILGEVGLIILALPFVVKHIFSSLDSDDWFTSAWIISLFASLAMIFFEYTGNAGPTAISRMQAHFLSVIKLLAVPLVWNWAKSKSENLKSTVLGLGLAAIFSGVAIFGAQVTAMPRPVSAIFLEDVDTTMFYRHWNTLDQNSLVFDPVYPRGVTILGIPTRSSITMGENLPEWRALKASPDPYDLFNAGFKYVYTDLDYYQDKTTFFNSECVLILDKISKEDSTVGRILLSLENCTK
ncbi:MAG TPA: hypothetical protein VN226_06715 [Anaerolineales bacterium]|nr:hypothetical protein [Anaerolineales bacterium]